MRVLSLLALVGVASATLHKPHLHKPHKHKGRHLQQQMESPVVEGEPNILLALL